MKLLIEFKSKLSRFKNVESKNKAFNALSDEDKRKEIAWDSLQLILTEKVTGSIGSYWSQNLYDIKLRDSKLFQSELLKAENCSVCARGAVMLSQIRLGNSINSSDYSKDSGNDRNLKGFTMNSMILMENEYEHEAYDHPFSCNTTAKLANILCNVIVNGDFNTEDRSVYVN